MNWGVVTDEWMQNLVEYLKAAVSWIGHVNRMDSTRKVSQIFNNNPQGRRVRGRPKNR
jgi:hypothetical protein